MKRRSLASNARPTGRMHPPGQAVRLGFVKTLMVALVLVDGSTGWPSLPQMILLKRYPSGGERFL